MERLARRHRQLAIASALLFGVLAVGGLVVVQLDGVQRQAAGERVALAQASTVRAVLEEELYRSVNLGRALRSYAVAYPELEDRERLDGLLADLYAQGTHVRNIGIAPDDVIEVVHPLEGNEDALGLRYEDVPDQYAAVQRARRTRSTVLDGPVELVQGGVGLVNRTPVFLPDGSYWGLVSLVLDVDSIMEEVRARTEGAPISWAVRTLDADGEPAVVVEGDPALFDRAETSFEFAVPDGTWEVAAVSTATAGVDVRMLGLRLAVLLVAGLIAWLVHRVVSDRWQVHSLSLHDPLTGLPNRRLLDERFDQVAAMARRAERTFCLVYVDLDDFKPVNDTHGHRAGDRVLAHIGARLAERIRETDTVARVGGDEFVVLLPDTDEIGAIHLARQVETVIAEPVSWDGHTVSIGASTGVAVFPRDGIEADELIHRADERMYETKRRRHVRSRREGVAPDR